MVVFSGKFPSSENPSRSPNTGSAMPISSRAPMKTEAHGCRWTTRLHRYAIVSRSGFWRRMGTSRLRGPAKNPAISTTTATGKARSSGVKLRPAPTRASAASPAAIRPRQRVSSTRSPAKPSSAGSSVTDATIVTATTEAAPMANPVTKLTPMINMPISEMTTVVPANTTARPAVSMAIDVASRTV